MPQGSSTSKPLLPRDEVPLTLPASIRVAGVEDEMAITGLLYDLLAETAYNVAPIDPERVAAQLHQATRGKGGFALLAEHEGVPAGILILVPIQWWWSQKVFLQDVAYYVAPEARGSSIAMDLLAGARWLADRMSSAVGYTVFAMVSVTAPHRREAKMRLVSRHMHPLGGTFIHPKIEGSDDV